MRIVVALLLVLPVAASALSLDDYGAKVGMQVTNLSADPSGSRHGLEDRRGLTVGAFADWAVRTGLGLTTELAYVQRGAKFHVLGQEDGGPVLFSQWDNRIDVVSLTILPRFERRTDDRILFIALGPRLDRRLASVDDSVFGSDIGGDIYDERDWIPGVEFAAGVVFDKASLEMRAGRDLVAFSEVPEDGSTLTGWSAGVVIGIRP